jgi:hypothetical protein
MFRGRKAPIHFTRKLRGNRRHVPSLRPRGPKLIDALACLSRTGPAIAVAPHGVPPAISSGEQFLIAVKEPR